MRPSPTRTAPASDPAAEAVLVLQAGPRNALRGRLWRRIGSGLLAGAVIGLGALLQARPAGPALGLGGGLLVAVALVGVMVRAQGRVPRQSLSLDPASGRARLLTWPPSGPPHQVDCALADVQPPRVYTQPSAPDTPEQPIVEVTLANGAWIASDTCDTEAAAQACATRIRAMIAAAARAEARPPG